ncbi:MAG: ribosome maturation factor RimP [Gemmatimonadota bacterium]
MSAPHFVFSGVPVVVERDTLERELASRVEDLGYELVEVRHGGTARRPHLTVRIDRPSVGPRHGVTVDDCALVSRALEAWLDERSVGEGRYILEVSSPGVDRPLKRLADWKRFMGEPVDLLVPQLGGRFRVTATQVFDQPEPAVELQFPKGVRRVLKLAEIKDARLGFDW